MFVTKNGATGVRKAAVAACCFACLSIGAGFPALAVAQEIDVTAKIHPVLTSSSAGSNTVIFTWDQLDLLAQIKQAGHPFSGMSRGAVGSIPSPFGALRTSGESSIDFSVDGPSSTAILNAHLEKIENSDVPASTMFASELRGRIANIIVPPRSIATIALEFDVTSSVPHGLSYQFSAFLGTPTGYGYWEIPVDRATSHTLFSDIVFDNSQGSQPLHTGPVQFSAGINFQTVPIPEPSQATMLIAGLLLLTIYGNSLRSRIL